LKVGSQKNKNVHIHRQKGDGGSKNSKIVTTEKSKPPFPDDRGEASKTTQEGRVGGGPDRLCKKQKTPLGNKRRSTSGQMKKLREKRSSFDHKESKKKLFQKQTGP